MSIMNISTTMQRIAAATEESPIAVFKHHDHQNLLDVMFASTVLTQAAIERKDPSLIGVYHGNMDLPQVKAELKNAVGQHAAAA